MLSVLHVSDIHLGPPFRPEAGEALLEIAPTLDHDVLVVSGDFTQRAKESQFSDARKLVDRLSEAPRVVVPGNHDVPLYRLWERLTNPNGLYRKHINDELEMTLSVDGAVLVGINTTSPRLTVTRGRVRRSSLDYAQRCFEQAPPGAIRVLVAHHQFVPAPDALDDGGLIGARNALRRLAEMKVDMVLGGHLHRGYVADSRDYLVKHPNEHGVLLIHSGTTTSRRGRGREKGQASFNLVHVYEERVVVTNYMFVATEKRFAPVAKRVMLRPGFGWLDAPSLDVAG